jgi:outer membrane receptor for ferrienterochelin and colicin
VHFDQWSHPQLSNKRKEETKGPHIYGAVAIDKEVKSYKLDRHLDTTVPVSCILDIVIGVGGEYNPNDCP